MSDSDCKGSENSFENIVEMSELLKNKYLIVSKAHCGYCVKAAEYLKSKDIDFVKISVSDDEVMDADNFDEFYDEMMSLNEQKTFPVIFIDGKYIGGYTDLIKLV